MLDFILYVVFIGSLLAIIYSLLVIAFNLYYTECISVIFMGIEVCSNIILSILSIIAGLLLSVLLFPLILFIISLGLLAFPFAIIILIFLYFKELGDKDK